MILRKLIKVKNKRSKIPKMRAREGETSVFTSLSFPKATTPAKRATQQTSKKEGDPAEDGPGVGNGSFLR